MFKPSVCSQTPGLRKEKTTALSAQRDGGEGCEGSIKGGLVIHQPVTPSHRLSEVIIFLPVQMLVHGHKPET